MRLTALVVATLLLVGQALAESAQETPLLPEVKKMLAMPAIDKSTMDQNAYVYLLGLTAEGDNYQEVGKKIVLYNETLIKEAIAKHKAELLFDVPDNKVYSFKEITPAFDNKINGKFYRYHCLMLANLNCVAEVIEQQTDIQALTERNELFLKRYLKVIQLPHYDTYYIVVASPIPRYQHLIVLSGVRQAEAVEAINKGDITKGLTILQEEITFSKRMLADNSLLIDAMIAIRLLMTQYHTLCELIDLPMMAKELNNPQLLALFKPFTKEEEQALVAVFQKELVWQLQVSAATDRSFIDSQIKELQELGQAKPNYPLTFNKNKTLNMLHDFFARYIKLATVTLPEASTVYRELQQIQANHKQLSDDEIYQQYGADNFYTGFMFERAGSNLYVPYFYRFYDVINYLTLVNAKLAIKQAHITKEQVPAFLEKLADKAQNPYSKKPFSWDEQTQTLCSDWLARPGEDINVDIYGTQAKVKIIF